MSDLIDAVAYWRMSSSPQEKSIPQQRAEMLPKCKLAGVNIVREFRDEGISGGGMKKRDAYLDMLSACQARHKAGKPVAAVVCFDTSRFSRATSTETGHYIWEFQKVGVHRLFTWERWFDFRKEEDRAIFLIQQDFTNNRYLRDISLRVLRGKRDAAQAGYFTGGQVPYGFERVLVDEAGNEVSRIHRGEKVRLRKQGWRLLLAPIAEDDADADRQLERQTVLWLYDTFDTNNVSFRYLAEQLNLRGVPSPGTHYRYRGKHVMLAKWNVPAVRGVLTRPVYRGLSCLGVAGRGTYHRLVAGEIQAVEPGAKRTDNNDKALSVPMEYGGIVDADLWDRVQVKVKDRRKHSTFARSGGYTLPGGILYCGHCGMRMYGCTMRPRRGEKVYEYRKYVCSSPNVKPGTCQHYAVSEDVIVSGLVDELLKKYLAPERLRGLEEKLLARAETKHQKAPATVTRLESRLADLDEGIVRGRRRALQAKDDETFAELNDGLREMLDQRKRLQKELDAARRTQQAPAEDLTAKVRENIAELWTLRESLETAAKDNLQGVAGAKEKLGGIIRALVSRADLYFERRENGKRVSYPCVRAAVKMRALLHVQGCEMDIKRSLPQPCTEETYVVHLAPDQLATPA